jgi:hypothetical protein
VRASAFDGIAVVPAAIAAAVATTVNMLVVFMALLQVLPALDNSAIGFHVPR